MIARLTAVTAAMLMFGGGALARAEAPVVHAGGAADLDDGERARALEAQLREDSQLSNNEINVDVTGKRVRLRGEVDNDAERRHAEDVIMKSDPTLSVDNQLAARTERKAGAPSSADDAKAKGKTVAHKAEKAAGEVADMATDAWITSKVKAQLMGADGVHASGINVDTADGVVTLHGNVRSEAERTRAVTIARQTRGTIKVIDQLAVMPRGK
jgi:hyperosmotically inducible protein